MSSEERLKDSLIAAGFDPTPGGLARATKMSARDAMLVFILCRCVPPEVVAAVRAATILRVRVAYLLGEDVPPTVMGSLTKVDIDALSIVAELDESGQQKWIRTGKHLTKL